MKSSNEVIEWIHSLLPFGIKPGLKRMEWMLERLGQPEKKINAVHIGGTNGKGSTVSFMRHVLIEAGYKIGTFTSPYIECFEERISINGTPIEEGDLVYCANVIRPLVEQLSKTELGSPTEFEVITTIAFYYFANVQPVDLVLVEVGLGGRFDSTNVITPLVSVLTSIGYDHMHILGDTIEQIAAEKAGIIKRNVPIVSGITQKEAKAIIKEKALNEHARYYELHEHFHEQFISSAGKEQVFSFSNDDIRLTCSLQMQGPHQRENAAVAMQTLLLLKTYGFTCSDAAIKEGLRKTTWPGRFEVIREEPLTIVDGAHNEQGMKALAATLKERYPHRRFHFLIAATKEKDMNILLEPFKSFEATYTFTSFPFFRAAKAVELYAKATVEEKNYEEDWEKAFRLISNKLKDDDILIICGSLYFISEVRNNWRSVETILHK